MEEILDIIHQHVPYENLIEEGSFAMITLWKLISKFAYIWYHQIWVLSRSKIILIYTL
jgi:hypothetical protein